jgi:hypothetical protein
VKIAPGIRLNVSKTGLVLLRRPDSKSLGVSTTESGRAAQVLSGRTAAMYRRWKRLLDGIEFVVV